MSLSQYLAEKYQKKPETKPKAKKRRHGLVDDEPSGWGLVPRKAVEQQDSEEGPSPVKKPSKGWKKVSSAVEVETIVTVDQAESKPQLQESQMSSGARAGLQTAEQVARDMQAQREAEMAAVGSLAQTETVYRDASGQIIDIEAHLRLEQEKKLREKLESARKQRELNEGLVQRQAKVEQAMRLEKARGEAFSKSVDDKELNAELRDRERFDDPALGFLKTKPKDKKSVQTAITLPTYKGSYAPNRFDIAPGPKWDGVDRSNGYEARWFARQNELRETKTLQYSMSYDE